MKKNREPAFRLALLYCSIASLWVFLSHGLLVYMVSGSISSSFLFVLKNEAFDLGFAVVTAVLFYTLLRNQFRRLEKEAESRKQAEKKLCEYEERYRALFDRSIDCVFLSDFAGNFLDANQSALNLVGYQREDIPKLSFGSLFTEDQLPLAFQSVEEIRTTGFQKQPTEFRLRCKDGRQVVVEIQSSLIFRDEKPYAVQGIARDITERKRMEEELRAGGQRFRQLFDSHSAVKLVTDPETGNIVDANTAAARFYGWPVEQLKQMQIGQINTLDAEALKLVVAQVKTAGQSRFEFCHRLADGSIRDVEVFSNRVEIAGKVCLYSIIHDITDRKEAEAALRRINHLYAVLSQVSQAIVNIKDAEALYERLCRIFVEAGGFSMAWIGLMDATSGILKPVCHFGHEDGYLEKVTITFNQDTPLGKGPTGMAISQGQVFINNDTENTAEMRPWRDEAMKRGYHSSAAVPFQCRGKICGAATFYSAEPGFFTPEERSLLNQIGHDISFALDALAERNERETVEMALREKDAMLQEAQEIASLGCYVLDIPTGIWRSSEVMDQVLGIGKDYERSVEGWRLLIHPEDRVMINDYFEKEVLGQGRDFNKEYRIIRPNDQAERWVFGIGKLEFDAHGHAVKMRGTIQDITERKRMEAAHDQLATVVEQASETIVITDIHGTILYVNPAFEKSTGYTRAEALGQNPRVLKSGRQDAEFYRQMWAVLASGEVWRGHFSNKRKDGTVYEEEATITPMRDDAGKITSYAAVKRDVTHEVELESQIRQTQKMEAVGLLASGVAHDFNNILAVIQLQAGILKSEKNLSPKQMDLAGEIEKATGRAANLTRQLLLFSRKQAMHRQDLDLNDSVASITKMLQRVLGEDIHMQFKLAPQPLWVHADAGMMDQVLMNLAVNARDAMPGGGQLVIETSLRDFDENTVARSVQARPGSFVCISVSDSGSGIPPEILPKIFEPFFTTKDVGKGSGLGLATVLGIVEQHGGWIDVYSEIGWGTTFKVYLPRLPKLSDKREEWSSLASVVGGNETILLVEDDAFLSASIHAALVRLGYHVLKATNGPIALEIWKQHATEIHLLLTDMVMPEGMNGKELAQKLLAENPKLKVIYASGYSADTVGQDFHLREGVNFLSKPFESHKLAQIIRCLGRNLIAPGGNFFGRSSNLASLSCVHHVLFTRRQSLRFAVILSPLWKFRRPAAADFARALAQF